MGSEIKLKNACTLWCHDVKSKDWSINSYNTLCTVDNVSDYWKLVNNMNKLDTRHKQYFFMIDDVLPIWEDPRNKNGGILSFKVDFDKTLELWEDLTLYLIADKIIEDGLNDITGISLNPKQNFALIKIWNSSDKNDISKTLNSKLLEKYNNIPIKFTKISAD